MACSPVSAALPDEPDCSPSEAVSVVAIQGTFDPIISSDGGSSLHSCLEKISERADSDRRIGGRRSDSFGGRNAGDLEDGEWVSNRRRGPTPGLPGPKDWPTIRDHSWLLEMDAESARDPGWTRREREVLILARQLWERLGDDAAATRLEEELADSR